MNLTHFFKNELCTLEKWKGNIKGWQDICYRGRACNDSGRSQPDKVQFSIWLSFVDNLCLSKSSDLKNRFLPSALFKWRERLPKGTLNVLWKGMLYTNTSLPGRHQNNLSIISCVGELVWIFLKRKTNKPTWWVMFTLHVFTSLKHREIMYVYLWLHSTKKRKKIQLKLD